MELHKRLTFAIAVAATITCNAEAQEIEVCKWHNDKKAAVVLTFDDWTVGQYPIAVKELNKRGMSATFFLMDETVKDWSKVNETAQMGNEIANHTFSHPNMTTISGEKIGTEIKDMERLIGKNVASQQVCTFAYPFGAYNDEIIDSLIANGYLASRSCEPPSKNYTYNFAKSERDYFSIPTFGMDGKVTTEKFFDEVEKIIANGGLLTYLYHSVDDAQKTYNDNWYATVEQDSLQKQLDALLSVSDKIWVTTLAKAVKYHREAQSASIKTLKENKKQTVISVTTSANNDKLDMPLSIKVKTDRCSYKKVMQGKKELKSTTNENNEMIFDVVPNGDEIILLKK